MRHHGVHGVHACRHVAVPGLCQPGVLWPGPFYGPTWPAPGVWGQHGAEGSIKALAKTTVFGQNHEEPWYSVKVVPEIPLISFTQNISEVFDQKKNHQTISDPLQALQATWLHCSSSLMCCLAKCTSCCRGTRVSYQLSESTIKTPRLGAKWGMVPPIKWTF